MARPFRETETPSAPIGDPLRAVSRISSGAEWFDQGLEDLAKVANSAVELAVAQIQKVKQIEDATAAVTATADFQEKLATRLSSLDRDAPDYTDRVRATVNDLITETAETLPVADDVVRARLLANMRLAALDIVTRAEDERQRAVAAKAEVALKRLADAAAARARRSPGDRSAALALFNEQAGVLLAQMPQAKREQWLDAVRRDTALASVMGILDAGDIVTAERMIAAYGEEGLLDSADVSRLNAHIEGERQRRETEAKQALQDAFAIGMAFVQAGQLDRASDFLKELPEGSRQRVMLELALNARQAELARGEVDKVDEIMAKLDAGIKITPSETAVLVGRVMEKLVAEKAVPEGSEFAREVAQETVARILLDRIPSEVPWLVENLVARVADPGLSLETRMRAVGSLLSLGVDRYAVKKAISSNPDVARVFSKIAVHGADDSTIEAALSEIGRVGPAERERLRKSFDEILNTPDGREDVDDNIARKYNAITGMPPPDDPLFWAKAYELMRAEAETGKVVSEAAASAAVTLDRLFPVLATSTVPHVVRLEESVLPFIPKPLLQRFGASNIAKAIVEKVREAFVSVMGEAEAGGADFRAVSRISRDGEVAVVGQYRRRGFTDWTDLVITQDGKVWGFNIDPEKPDEIIRILDLERMVETAKRGIVESWSSSSSIVQGVP